MNVKFINDKKTWFSTKFTGWINAVHSFQFSWLLESNRIPYKFYFSNFLTLRMLRFSLIFLILAISCCLAVDDIVETENGKVQGISLKSRKGRTYYGFLGVPFGKIPKRFAVLIKQMLIIVIFLSNLNFYTHLRPESQRTLGMALN